MIYSLHGGLDKIERIVPEDFFLLSKFGHMKVFRKMKELDCKAIMANAEHLSQLTAIMACELRFTKANYGEGFAKDYFGEKNMVVDLTQTAFAGLDGNIFSVYLTCEDAGCFILYSPALNRIHYATVALEKVDEVEELLFKRCADGYVQVDNELLVKSYPRFEAEFRKNTELQNLRF